MFRTIWSAIYTAWAFFILALNYGDAGKWIALILVVAGIGYGGHALWDGMNHNEARRDCASMAVQALTVTAGTRDSALLVNKICLQSKGYGND